ncbi:Hypothetical predicted protein [Olea europaea subsp. europaea]|uniref:Uncharacterized protein n=1 Tax=Olea europaea subsp. europaea TaxID=158383 RepID=A0A8S0UMB7_OLEEU|nr:Hypothetical predicted protein [Olea europaea subsp. europaea]
MELNPYANFFRTLTNIPNLKSHNLKIRSNCGLDQRVYNTPCASQVAAIWVDDDSTTNERVRDIAVSCNSGEKHQVHYYSGCYDLLQYPLLFPFGETGWHQGIVRIDKRRRQQTCANENLFDIYQLNSAAEIFAVENTGE